MRILLLLTLVAGVIPTLAAAQAPSGLLPIGEAYKFSADANTPGVVTVHWAIAPGYYLYRGQMKFCAGKDTTLGEPRLPEGKKYHDEYLGDVETYHDKIEAGVAYTVAPGATRIQLSVRYQGCHEVEPKLCYPPHTETVDLPVPKATKTVAAAPSAPPTRATMSAAKSGPARYLGSAAAQVALKEGEKAKQSGHHDEAVSEFKKAISLDPYFAKAHESYLNTQRFKPIVDFFSGSRVASLSAEEGLASESAGEERGKGLAKVTEQMKRIAGTLIREYTLLVKQHPENAVYPWALGSLYNETDIARQEKYCRQALQIDKDFAQAYECLANIASMRNDHLQALAYQRQAMELMPDDPGLAGNYVWMLKDNTETADTEIKSLLVRFPDSPLIALALINRAWKQKTEAARIDALEKLRKDAPASSKPVAALAAEKLYPIYLGADLAKAKGLAQEMTRGSPESQKWAARRAYVDALMKAQGEIDAGQAESALTTLKAVQKQQDEEFAKRTGQLNRPRDEESVVNEYLLQAKALDAAGKTAEAVKMLSDEYAVFPTDAVQAALMSYGEKLGKTSAQLNDGVWAVLKSKAKPAHPFTLKRADNDQPVSLSDYRGKVVIVDFWYPNCGPCRASFPYWQNVAAKYKDKGVTVVAINGMEDQEAEILAVIKGYDFLALKGNEKFASDAYGVWSYPTTFLIGADGNIYFYPHLADDAHQRSAELAVEFLLARSKP